MTPVFRCVGHEWVTLDAQDRQVRALVHPPDGLPRDHNWSCGDLEAVPRRDPLSDLLHGDREALACGTAVGG